MPDASNSFSLYRTVLNAVGRAPSAPMRTLRRSRTTRHVAANRRISSRNDGASGATVWSEVIEYLIPYWVRLLQTDILPQKLSRRNAIRSEEHTSELQSQFHLVCRL